LKIDAFFIYHFEWYAKATLDRLTDPVAMPS